MLEHMTAFLPFLRVDNIPCVHVACIAIGRSGCFCLLAAGNYAAVSISLSGPLLSILLDPYEKWNSWVMW
jgi:hypothetical protein